MIRVYLDLDGVLADFEKYYLDVFGHRHDSVKDDVMWDNILSLPKFFEVLPLIDGAKEFFEYFREYDPIILTACHKTHYKQHAIEKKIWVRENIDLEIQILPVTGGKNKALFMHKPGDILIDDFYSNIKAWRDLGGIGIHHKNFDDSLKQFESLKRQGVFK